MKVRTTIEVDSRQAKTYRALEKILGAGKTMSLDENQNWGPGVWRLNFIGSMWVFIHPQGWTEEDVLRHDLDITDEELIGFENNGQGMLRAS